MARQTRTSNESACSRFIKRGRLGGLTSFAALALALWIWVIQMASVHPGLHAWLHGHGVASEACHHGAGVSGGGHGQEGATHPEGEDPGDPHVCAVLLFLQGWVGMYVIWATPERSHVAEVAATEVDRTRHGSRVRHYEARAPPLV